MNLYKIVLISVLFLVSVGSVCATDPDNTTHANLTDNQNTINEVNNIINKALEKKDIEIKALQDNDIKQFNEIQQLKDNTTQLDKRVKALENSNKQLLDSNKVLNNTVNKLTTEIKTLNVLIVLIEKMCVIL